jgi:hypothetical protein
VLSRAFTYLTSICILLSACSELQAQEDNTYRELYKKNRVKSVTIYEHKLWGEHGKGLRKKLLFRYEYDTSGLLRKHLHNMGWWLGKSRSAYAYDEHDNLLADTSLNYREPFITNYINTYDEQGRMVEKIKRYDAWYYVYDDNGNLVQEKWIMDTRVPSMYFTEKYEYDSDNRKIKWTRYHADGTEYFYFTYLYDAAGNIIKQTRHQHGEVTNIFTYSYDILGQQTGSAHFYATETEKLGWSKTWYHTNGLIHHETGKLMHEDRAYYRRYVYEFH